MLIPFYFSGPENLGGEGWRGAHTPTTTRALGEDRGLDENSLQYLLLVFPQSGQLIDFFLMQTLNFKLIFKNLHSIIWTLHEGFSILVISALEDCLNLCCVNAY